MSATPPADPLEPARARRRRAARAASRWRRRTRTGRRLSVPSWTRSTPRAALLPGAHEAPPQQARCSRSTSARSASGCWLPTHGPAAGRAGDRLARPGDAQRVASAVEHPADERVVAGTHRRGVGGRDDPALVVDGDGHRIGRGMEIQEELRAPAAFRSQRIERTSGYSVASQARTSPRSLSAAGSRGIIPRFDTCPDR